MVHQLPSPAVSSRDPTDRAKRPYDTSIAVGPAGPANNRGSASITGSPAQGSFLIDDLVPSTSVDPEEPYRVRARASFRNDLGERETFRSPSVNDVSVPEGGRVDLGDTFVMRPSFIRGELSIVGPGPDTELGIDACLERYTKTGAQLTGVASGPGSASASVAVAEPTLSASGAVLGGKYQLIVGAPNNAESVWRPRYTAIAPFNVDAAEGNSRYTTIDGAVNQIDLRAGQERVADVSHCVARVTSRFIVNDAEAETGFTFPRYTFSGAQVTERGTVTFSGSSNGFPARGEEPVREAAFNSCIPAGDITFRPQITAVGPDGVSETDLLDIRANIPCRAVVNPFAVNFSTGACGIGASSVAVTGTAAGVFGPAEASRIVAVVNGNELSVCSDTEAPCDLDFNFDIPTSALQQCGNTVEVRVFDVNGELSTSGPQNLVVQVEPPASAACQDASLAVGDSLNLEEHVSGLNPCELDETVPLQCFNATLGFAPITDLAAATFPSGTTEVQCFRGTQCTPRLVCPFDVTVE